MSCILVSAMFSAVDRCLYWLCKCMVCAEKRMFTPSFKTVCSHSIIK